MLNVVSTSADDTQTIAARLVECVTDHDIVMLVGDMGSGKTTFAQGFGKALGVDEPITSPTFVLMRSYAGRMTLHHVDIYRLDHLQEVIDLGLVEQLDDGGVALVEWGDLATPVLPRDFLEVRFQVPENDSERHITVSPVGAGWSAREKAVADALAPWLVETQGGQQ